MLRRRKVNEEDLSQCLVIVRLDPNVRSTVRIMSAVHVSPVRTESSGKEDEKDSGEKGKREKPYKCKSCEKTFRIIGDRNKHYKTVHLKIKRFKCEKCDRAYFQESELLYHDKVFHKSTDEMLVYTVVVTEFIHSYFSLLHFSHSEIKDYKCDLCGKVYFFKHELRKHVDSVHKNKKPFPCNECYLRFFTAALLRRHVKAVHKIETKNNLAPRAICVDHDTGVAFVLVFFDIL
ncbi:unnamed protein product [Hymenolepis diminuta]|uniref:C2H2-type domain-containing protein n=1 Tax=Hymenolepis diminuta TaxID=6216 RepID=A0A0R3SKG8_HYMDI|nr:unnamed protein product [Hymenolepis diminuta]